MAFFLAPILFFILGGCPKEATATEGTPVSPLPAAETTTKWWPDGCRTCTCIPDGELHHCVCELVDEAMCEVSPVIIEE